jgi:hypothetical protein
MYGQSRLKARYDSLFMDEIGLLGEGEPDLNIPLVGGCTEVLPKRIYKGENGNVSSTAKDWEQVGYAISDKPMISRGITTCCSTALIGDGLGALTHYNSVINPEKEPDCPPKDYLPSIIKKLADLGQTRLKAALVGGSKDHYKGVLDVLKAERIPVVGRYSDGIRNSFPSGGDTKSLAYFPDSGEVILKAVRTTWKGMGSENRVHFKQLSPWTLISNIPFL